MLLRLIIILTAAITLLCTCAFTQNSDARPSIQLNTSARKSTHPLTLEEIIALREITESQISPDGRTVAFIVTQASLALNDYRAALFVVQSSHDSDPVKLLEGKNLSNLRWTPDNQYISYLSTNSGSPQVWRVRPDRGKTEQVTTHVTGISQYEWSSDGQKMAFLSSGAVKPEEKADIEAQGIIYDDEKYSHRNLVSGSWVSKSTQLWIYSVAGKDERLWGNEQTDVPSISRFVWSPDGEKIALEYRPSNKPQDLNTDVGVLDLRAGKFSPVITWEGFDEGVSWSPDSRSLAFVSQGNIKQKELYYDARFSIYKVGLDFGEPIDIAKLSNSYSLDSVRWSKDGASIFYEWDDRSRSALYQIPSDGGVARRVSESPDYLSSFSFDLDYSKASCVRQNPSMPPEIAVLDLKSGVPRTLTQLNPEYKDVNLGEVSELCWTNRYGNETNGFLIKPFGYVQGRRYPLLVILYGFSGKFISQAQWMSSYPAQPFTADGFAVLLMNYPLWKGWRYGDFKKGAFWQGYNPLASIEAGVQRVVDMGIADPQKKGIMGWSFGSFLTEFTITHSDLFEAASAGEGGLWNAGQYWLLGSASMRYILEGLFGGPPYRDTYQRYQEFSPALNAQRVRAPLLREYGSIMALQSLEFYTAMRRYGKPVEQVIYPDEPHIFSQPKHRLSSMQRNLDWFNFWLQGKEDSKSHKKEQYERWRKMRVTG